MYITIGSFLSIGLFILFGILILATITEAVLFFIDDKNYKDFAHHAKTIPLWVPFQNHHDSYVTEDDAGLVILMGTIVWIVASIFTRWAWPVTVLAAIIIPLIFKVRERRRIKKEILEEITASTNTQSLNPWKAETVTDPEEVYHWPDFKSTKLDNTIKAHKAKMDGYLDKLS